MEEKLNFANIIKDIIGEKEYVQLLTEVSREASFCEVNIDTFFEDIFNKYCFLIILLGLSKKVEIKSYKFKTDNETIEIDSQIFASKYKKYVELIEDKMFNLIKKLI